MATEVAEEALDQERQDPESVWRTAWESERGPLLSFLRRQVRDAETAEDLLQETFVRAIRSGRIEERESLRSYLFTIAQNLASDHWRRHFRLVPTRAEEPAAGFDGVADSRAESPEEATSRRRLEERLREALEELPEHYQVAFRLAAIEQHSYREVAVTMGWTLDQVRINVHRARKRLIGLLGGERVAETRT